MKCFVNCIPVTQGYSRSFDQNPNLPYKRPAVREWKQNKKRTKQKSFCHPTQGPGQMAQTPCAGMEDHKGRIRRYWWVINCDELCHQFFRVLHFFD